MMIISTINPSVETGLRFAGIWPGSPYKTLFQFIWTITLGISQVFQYRYLMVHFNFNDLTNLVDGLSTTLPYSLLLLKLIIFWFNHGIFKEILTAMSRDWIDSAGIDFCVNPMRSKAILSHRYSKLIIGIYGMAVIFYSIATIEDAYSTMAMDLDIQHRELLIKMEFPFVTHKSLIYECILFVQFLQLLAVATTIGIINALVITLMLHIGGQIDIMRQTLTAISPKDFEHGLPRITIKSIIRRHYKIIAMSKNVRNLFMYIALLQLVSNTLIICCIGFLITTSIGTSESVKMLVKSTFFYIAVTLEAFILCFSGEYLRSKSKIIGDAVYESLWYVLWPNDSRMLLLLLVRSQSQLTITAGSFIDLSLESFLSILKASASYMSVLHAMY